MIIGSIIQDRGLEALGRFYSSYRGVVIDDQDPDNLGRLKVLVPEISLDRPDWAFPKGLHGGIDNGFKYLTPKVGSIVWVEFKNGDLLYPIWSYHGWAKGEMPDDLKDNDTMGIVTPGNHKIILNDNEGILYISISDAEGKEVFSFTINRGKLTIKGETLDLLDANHGIPLVDKLVEKLNTLENQMNDLKEKILTATSSVKPSDGGASAFAVLSQFSSGRLTPTKISDIENPKIKQ